MTRVTFASFVLMSHVVLRILFLLTLLSVPFRCLFFALREGHRASYIRGSERYIRPFFSRTYIKFKRRLQRARDYV
jgi:hypothetical protein